MSPTTPSAQYAHGSQASSSSPAPLQQYVPQSDEDTALIAEAMKFIQPNPPPPMPMHPASAGAGAEAQMFPTDPHMQQQMMSPQYQQSPYMKVTSLHKEPIGSRWLNQRSIQAGLFAALVFLIVTILPLERIPVLWIHASPWMPRPDVLIKAVLVGVIIFVMEAFLLPL